jgi:UDP-N-acetylglucosamine 2-epimerase (hydrolysing)
MSSPLEKRRRLLFLTGTRADFGKLKPLIRAVQHLNDFDVQLFVTGMHLDANYGYTVLEIERSGFSNLHRYVNSSVGDTMDIVLSKTIDGLSRFAGSWKPDLLVVHGDRVEALAGAIVGSLNNVLVGHIEGGEVSGTVDDLLRHAITKLSHIHFVSNEKAQRRLLQMGESPQSIHQIGSPERDIMTSSSLPSLNQVVNYYDICFQEYAVLIFHPVTTELDTLREHTVNLVDAVLEAKTNIIAVMPNNDSGCGIVRDIFLSRFSDNPFIRLYPSLRFEYYLVLLKNSQFIIGNSSSGVREAPFFGIPSINIGTRQRQRSGARSIIDTGYGKADIMEAIKQIRSFSRSIANTDIEFGDGRSSERFVEIIKSPQLWLSPKQKTFVDQ